MKIKNTILLLLALFVFMGVKAQKISDCNAAFTYDKILSISPFTLSFTDISTSNIQRWKWTFGDGEYSQKQNPKHQYTNAGTYIVKLEIINDNNITSQFIDTIILTSEIKTVCSAMYNYSLLFKDSNYVYGFLDHSIAVNDSIISWEWDFDDGNISNYRNTIHRFVSQGSYSVTLKITTASLNNYYYTQNVVVNGLMDPCNANFNPVPFDSLTINFINSSQSDYPILSWHWDFGDGDTSNLQDPPTKEYSYAGVYNVTLTLTTEYCTDNFTLQVQVGSPQFYSIWGRVYAGNYTIDQCKAYLYQKFNGNNIVLKDTIDLYSINDSLGIYYFYQIPEGDYYIKVDIPSTSNYYGDYCPTYFGDSPLWMQSQIMQVYSDKHNQHINLEPVIHQSGTNFISGSITNTANGDIEDILTLLYDANNDLLDFTYSDSNGYYSFSQVPTGSFSIYGELIGFTAYPAMTPLLNNNDSINNVNFFIENAVSTGIIQNEEHHKEFVFNIYPNPASGNSITLAIDNEQNDVFSYIITNNLGVNIKNGELYSNKNSISINHISKGLFYISIFDSNNIMIGCKKLIIQ